MAKSPRYDGLRADMPVERGGRIVVGTLWSVVLELAPSALRGDDTRAVHDMRVGIRRMRSALASFEGSFPAKECRSARRAIRRLGRKLGTVRDGDVHLALLRAALGGAPEIERAGIAFAIDRVIERKRAALAAFAIELSQFDRERIARLIVDA